MQFGYIPIVIQVTSAQLARLEKEAAATGAGSVSEQARVLIVKGLIALDMARATREAIEADTPPDEVAERLTAIQREAEGSDAVAEYIRDLQGEFDE
jgi:hypothetical protein